jgi:hypothetical protein
VVGGAAYSRGEDGAWKPMAADGAVFVAGHAFHAIALDPDRFISGLGAPAPADFHGRSALAREGRDPIGSPAFVYADRSGRPLGLRYAHPAKPGVDIDVIFEDWTVRDGRPVFARALILDGDDVYHYRFTTVAFDTLTDLDFPTADEVAAD